MAERENMRCDFDLIIDEICRRLKAENSLREAEQKSTFSEAEILRLKKELGEVKGRNIDLHNEYVLLKTHYESPLFLSMMAISRSSAVSPARTSHIKMMTSAVSIAICACVRICARMILSVLGSIPPVSMSVIFLLRHSVSP